MRLRLTYVRDLVNPTTDAHRSFARGVLLVLTCLNEGVLGLGLGLGLGLWLGIGLGLGLGLGFCSFPLSIIKPSRMHRVHHLSLTPTLVPTPTLTLILILTLTVIEGVCPRYHHPRYGWACVGVRAQYRYQSQSCRTECGGCGGHNVSLTLTLTPTLALITHPDWRPKCLPLSES